MISKLMNLFRRSPQEPLQEVADPVLGPCVPDQGERWWRATVEVGGRKVAFTLGGSLLPDAALLSHARQIVGEFGAFEKRVADFLRREAVRIDIPEARAEIESLKIDDVCLFWPDRPNDGMIYFSGPADEGRLWRCDYVQRQCQSLGCDT